VFGTAPIGWPELRTVSTQNAEPSIGRSRGLRAQFADPRSPVSGA